jgi:mannose-6-phosphate isomerase-like protein (cupin superfamily)
METGNPVRGVHDGASSTAGETMRKVNITDALARIHEHWRPMSVAELNGQEVRLVKFRGAFPWHHHEQEDELFMGVRGRFRLEFADGSVEIGPGDLIVVPRGTEHRPVADEEVEVLLFEPAATRNTGNVVDPVFTAPPQRRGRGGEDGD